MLRNIQAKSSCSNGENTSVEESAWHRIWRNTQFPFRTVHMEILIYSSFVVVLLSCVQYKQLFLAVLLWALSTFQEPTRFPYGTPCRKIKTLHAPITELNSCSGLFRFILRISRSAAMRDQRMYSFPIHLLLTCSHWLTVAVLLGCMDVNTIILKKINSVAVVRKRTDRATAVCRRS
jgi:hypothetical protein